MKLTVLTICASQQCSCRTHRRKEAERMVLVVAVVIVQSRSLLLDTPNILGVGLYLRPPTLDWVFVLTPVTKSDLNERM